MYHQNGDMGDPGDVTVQLCNTDRKIYPRLNPPRIRLVSLCKNHPGKPPRVPMDTRQCRAERIRRQSQLPFATSSQAGTLWVARLCGVGRPENATIKNQVS
jgi:hypothetical protein